LPRSPHAKPFCASSIGYVALPSAALADGIGVAPIGKPFLSVSGIGVESPIGGMPGPVCVLGMPVPLEKLPEHAASAHAKIKARMPRFDR
jgi:hypothetical protein